MKSLCYFVRLADKNIIYHRRWYVDELKMLQELGYDVKLCTKYTETLKKRDVYVSWWAQTSVFSVLSAKIHGKTSLVIAGGTEISKVVPNVGYNKKNIIKRGLIQLSLRLSNVIVAVSEYNKQEILEIINNDKYADKIKVLYHCVSDIYLGQKIVFQFEEKEKYYLLITGFIKGNLERKCVYQVVDAIYEISKEIPEIKLVIAGAVEEENEYRKLITYIRSNYLEKNVDVITNVNEKEKIKLLNGAYYYLQPSIHEQFGLAIAEAMACGCPVISTSVAAIPEVVGDTGILIKENKQEEIMKAVKETYFDEQNRYINAVAAQKRIKELFGYEIKKKKFNEIIECAINN